MSPAKQDKPVEKVQPLPLPTSTKKAALPTIYDSDSDDLSDTERILLERRRKNDEWMEQIEKERQERKEAEMGRRKVLEEEEQKVKEQEEKKRVEDERKKQAKEEQRRKARERREADKRQKAKEKEAKQRLKEEEKAKAAACPPRVPQYMGEIDDDEGKWKQVAFIGADFFVCRNAECYRGENAGGAGSGTGCSFAASPQPRPALNRGNGCGVLQTSQGDFRNFSLM